MPLIRGDQAESAIRRASPVNLADIARAGEELAARSRAEADKLIDAARKERSSLISGAAEKGHAEGFAKGHAEGLRRGRDEGAAKALDEKRAEIDRLIKDWMRNREAFEAERDRLLSEARTSVLTLALTLAEKITRHTLASDPALVQRQVQAALELVARGSRAVVVVDPASAKRVRESLPALARAFGDEHLVIEADPSLAPGACLVRTSSGGQIDASIDTQLERIARALLGEADSEGSRPVTGDAPKSAPAPAGPAPRLTPGTQERAA